MSPESYISLAVYFFAVVVSPLSEWLLNGSLSGSHYEHDFVSTAGESVDAL